MADGSSRRREMPPEDQGARGPEDNSSSPLDSRFSTSGDSIDNAAQASGEIEPHQDLGHRPGYLK